MTDDVALLYRDPAFDRDWLNKNPIVPAVAFMGYESMCIVYLLETLYNSRQFHCLYCTVWAECGILALAHGRNRGISRKQCCVQ